MDRCVSHIGLLLCSTVVFLALPSEAYAGAWTQKNGGIYAKISATGELASEQYKETGDTFQLLSQDDPGSYRALSTFLYAEYGLVPKLTVITSGSYKSMTVDSERVLATTHGVGDFSFGLKWQFLDKPFVLSTMAQGTFPTGYTADHPDPRTPALGNGVRSGELALLIGKSFYPVPVYASARGGFRLRGARLEGGPDFPPEIPYFVEVGWGPVDWMWVRAFANGMHGLGNPEAIDTVEFTPLTQRFLQAGPSVIVTLADHYQINVDYAYTLLGVNTLRSHQLTVGFAFEGSLLAEDK